MTKTRDGLIEFCKSKLGTPYVFGSKGEIMTEQRIAQLTKENPKMFTASYIAKSRNFIGRACTDCSGLISWYTGVLRGSANFCDTAAERYPVSQLNESMRGWALWKPGHIGVYIGNGKCVEAKGINYGTVESKVSSTPWQKVIKLKDIDYSADSGVPTPVPASSEPPAKAGWVRVKDKWRYYQAAKNGGLQPIANDWLKDGDGRWYWFDGAGNAISENWYLYATGEQPAKWYYFGPDCAMVTGLMEIDGAFYYFDSSGAMAGPGSQLVFQPDENGVLHIKQAY